MQKYILFGAGKDGIKAMEILGNEVVECYCDNLKAGMMVRNKKVISISCLKKIYQDYIVVITTSNNKYMVEIALQLSGEGIPFMLFDDIAKGFVKEDLQTYSLLNNRESFRYTEEYAYPIWNDKFEEAGSLHSYFWQDLWAAQKIYQNKPDVHCDIGSRVDGFIAHLLSFGQKVKLFDIRPLKKSIPGVEFVQCDATNMGSIMNESIESLSALCSLEHFGLGRYGDPIDPEACFKCFKAIQDKIQKGGKLYISVPVGKEHLEFNTHRVFYAQTIVNAFERMKLVEYSTAYNENMEYCTDLHKYDDFTQKGGDLFGLFVFEKS